MDRRDLEKRSMSELEKDGYLVQRALFSIKHLPNGKVISNQSDLFGAWDIIAVKQNECRLIQVCSGETFARHRRNIEEKFPNTSWATQELWYYFKEKSRWKRTVWLRTNGMGWQIQIPKTVREYLSLKEGDQVLMEITKKDSIEDHKRNVEKSFRRD